MREFINNQKVLGVSKPASYNTRKVTFDISNNSDSASVKPRQTDARPTSPRRGCSRCGDLRHSVTDCRSQNDNYRSPSPSSTCFTCGGRFHFQRDSPDYKLKDSSGCYSCGDGSHLARDCPRGMRPGHLRQTTDMDSPSCLIIDPADYHLLMIGTQSYHHLITGTVDLTCQLHILALHQTGHEAGRHHPDMDVTCVVTAHMRTDISRGTSSPSHRTGDNFPESLQINICSGTALP